jgi:hypothetical protein
MMNEVWPKQGAFGSVHYDSVRHVLKGMLESRDKEYWIILTSLPGAS